MLASIAGLLSLNKKTILPKQNGQANDLAILKFFLSFKFEDITIDTLVQFQIADDIFDFLIEDGIHLFKIRNFLKLFFDSEIKFYLRLCT
jgi:hypothetical protein